MRSKWERKEKERKKKKEKKLTNYVGLGSQEKLLFDSKSCGIFLPAVSTMQQYLCPKKVYTNELISEKVKCEWEKQKIKWDIYIYSNVGEKIVPYTQIKQLNSSYSWI